MKLKALPLSTMSMWYFDRTPESIGDLPPPSIRKSTTGYSITARKFPPKAPVKEEIRSNIFIPQYPNELHPKEAMQIFINRRNNKIRKSIIFGIGKVDEFPYRKLGFDSKEDAEGISYGWNPAYKVKFYNFTGEKDLNVSVKGLPPKIFLSGELSTGEKCCILRCFRSHLIPSNTSITKEIKKDLDWSFADINTAEMFPHRGPWMEKKLGEWWEKRLGRSVIR